MKLSVHLHYNKILGFCGIINGIEKIDRTKCAQVIFASFWQRIQKHLVHKQRVVHGRKNLYTLFCHARYNIHTFSAMRFRTLLLLLLLSYVHAVPVYLTQYVIHLNADLTAKSVSELQSIVHTDLISILTSSDLNVHIHNVTVTTS